VVAFGNCGYVPTYEAVCETLAGAAGAAKKK